jgi:hypothetical protein
MVPPVVPPLASFLGFKSRIWAWLLVFGFFVVFRCLFIWVFRLIVVLVVFIKGVLSQISREVTWKVQKQPRMRAHLRSMSLLQPEYCRGPTQPPLQLIRFIRAIRGEVYFGAREATTCSKRGSPWSGSQNGDNFNWP